MMKKHIQPDFLFLTTGLLVVACRLLFVDGQLDILIHDTYIVIDSLHVTFLIAFLFVVLTLPYTLFRKANKPLSKIGGWVHYALTMLPWLVSIVLSFTIRRYDSTHALNESMEYSKNYNTIITVSFILSLFGQLIFFGDIIVTLFKRKKKMQ